MNNNVTFRPMCVGAQKAVCVLTLDVLVEYQLILLKLYLLDFDLPGNKMSTFRSYSDSSAVTQ